MVLTSAASGVSHVGADLQRVLDAASGQPLRARALLIAFITRFIELVTLGHEQARQAALPATNCLRVRLM